MNWICVWRHFDVLDRSVWQMIPIVGDYQIYMQLKCIGLVCIPFLWISEVNKEGLFLGQKKSLYFVSIDSENVHNSCIRNAITQVWTVITFWIQNRNLVASPQNWSGKGRLKLSNCSRIFPRKRLIHLGLFTLEIKTTWGQSRCAHKCMRKGRHPTCIFSYGICEKWLPSGRRVSLDQDQGAWGGLHFSCVPFKAENHPLTWQWTSEVAFSQIAVSGNDCSWEGDFSPVPQTHVGKDHLHTPYSSLPAHTTTI